MKIDATDNAVEVIKILANVIKVIAGLAAAVLLIRGI